jgi:O-antigen/teichoic acid export membrane protein
MPSVAAVFERSRSYFHARDFISKVALTFVAKAALFVLGIAISILISRLLGPVNRGIYATALAITGLGVQFGNFGLHASNTYFVAKNKALAQTLVANTIVLSLGAGSVIGAVTLAFMLVRPDLLPLHGANLVLSVIGIPLGLSYLLFQNLLIGQYRIKEYNFIDIAFRLVNLLLLLLIAGLAALSSAKATLAYVIAVAIAGSLCLQRLTSVRRLERPSLGLFRQTFSYGFRAYLSAFFTYAVLRADLLLVGHVLGAQQTGYYSVAVNVADLIIAVPVTISTILFPKLVGMVDASQKWQQTKKVLIVLSIVVVCISGLAALAASWLIPLLFGARFASAIPAFRLLMPGVVFISLTSVLSAYVASEDIPWTVVAVYLAMSGLNVVLNIVWLPRVGINGASIASSICYLGCFLGLLLISRGFLREENRPVLLG